VLSASVAPRVPMEEWSFELKDGPGLLRKWTWSEFNELRQTRVTRDIHCVTTWSKLDTSWEGVLVEDVLAAANVGIRTPFLLAHSYDGYSTNIATADLEGNKALVALRYEGRPLERDHGGPARLLVPHLYFWKSAKWIKGLQFTQRDEPGFWETRGYHIRGDPWREQRYSND
jgi:DMSO/TMAO reductase YedYZ molybdopterin-dependent catalytic subunit